MRDRWGGAMPDPPIPPEAAGLHRCTWCGHTHDPEDGHCDSHAHVGVGRCPCPGDAQTLRYDRERVRRRIAAATFGRGYSVMEMAHDLERYATHPVWEIMERGIE
jgi:hypothetical protein